VFEIQRGAACLLKFLVIVLSYPCNVLTVTGMGFSMAAIFALFDHNLHNAMLFLLCATITDGLDGFLSREYGNINPLIGKTLDYYGDVVRCSVAIPAVFYVYFTQGEFELKAALFVVFLCSTARLLGLNTLRPILRKYPKSCVGLPTDSLYIILALIYPFQESLQSGYVWVKVFCLTTVSVTMLLPIEWPDSIATRITIFTVTVLAAVTLWIGHFS
jgi:phosphatidylserine synthase